MENEKSLGPIPTKADKEALTGRIFEVMERDFETGELKELLESYAGRMVIAFEAPAYRLKTHKQMGVEWLEPTLNEQQLSELVVRPSWMHWGIEVVYSDIDHDADGNAVIIGEFCVEDGKLIAIKLDEIEDLKVTGLYENNKFDEASDRYDENILRLASNR